MVLSTISTAIYLDQPIYPPSKPDVISLDDLLSDQLVAKKMEDDDKTALLNFFNPTMDSLKSQLLAWARQGFPMGGVINEITLNPPGICSDGQVRTLPFYVEFVTETSIVALLGNLNAKTTGMQFLYSWDGNKMTLRVNKL